MMVKLAVLTVAVSLSAVTVPPNAKIKVIDGDTVHIDGLKIRILNIDTPELHGARCFNEYKIGIFARRRLVQLLWRGNISYIPNGLDKYGRTLAWVYVGKDNVGEILVKEGHALVWEPGPEAKAARLAKWCGKDDL